MAHTPAGDGLSRRRALELFGAGLATVGISSATGLAESDPESAAGAGTGGGPQSPNGHAAADADAAVEDQSPKSTSTTGAAVTFEDQSPHYRTVFVAEVTLPDDGFVALHDASLFTEGPVVGVSPALEAGTYTNLPVQLDELPDGPLNVAAIPHEDTPSDGVFTHPDDGDTPYVGEDGVVHDIAEIRPE
jgi:hypothetical protein